jgi:signal transduction histidine kinase
LRQVLIDLSCAIKYTPEGGRVAIDARRRRSTDFRARAAVADTGIGIPSGTCRV